MHLSHGQQSQQGFGGSTNITNVTQQNNSLSSTTKKRKRRRRRPEEMKRKPAQDLVDSDDDYVEPPPLAKEDQPPALFDKYHFYSEAMMQNIGRVRPPQEGLGTFQQKFTLQELLDKRGGKLPESSNARTDYSRNFRVPYLLPETEHIRKYRGKIPNPAVKKVTLGSYLPMDDSHLMSRYPGCYVHQHKFPLPSMTPRVFPETHVNHTVLFKDKVRIRKPKYG